MEIRRIPLKRSPAKPPASGSIVQWETSDRSSTDVSRALTPSRVDTILTGANTGDTADQSQLAVEIEEKNWDIAHAVQTRRSAVAGLEWEVLPPEGDDSAAAKNAAADVEEMLRDPQWDDDEHDTFQEALFFSLQGALLPGFAVAEMIWSAGGRQLVGFQELEQRHFTFAYSRDPRLMLPEYPQGMELDRQKFVVHYHRARPGARCRGGLIRPLAWLHCFSTINLKDLLTFIERYGMPFLMTKVSDEAWNRDKNRLKYLIQNFGPAGGGVFTQNVETELLQAANSTGECYFRLLEYVDKAITKVVLGQTATSSDGGGLSGDNAQSDVRQDLLESDCRALENTVRARIIRPWNLWNKGENAPVPRLHLQCEPAEDLKATAETAATLYTAGLEWDEAEASDRFGMTLRRVVSAQPGQPAPAAAPAGGADPAAMEADSAIVEAEDTAGRALAELLAGRGLQQWLGPLQIAIESAVMEPDPERAREKILALTADLPGLYESMDSSALEEILERVMITEAAQGQATRAAELAAKERQ